MRTLVGLLLPLSAPADRSATAPAVAPVPGAERALAVTVVAVLLLALLA